jgi:hypothetical protein
MQDAFNGLGQLTEEWQSHSGAVNTSTTPNDGYGYASKVISGERSAFEEDRVGTDPLLFLSVLDQYIDEVAFAVAYFGVV